MISVRRFGADRSSAQTHFLDAHQQRIVSRFVTSVARILRNEPRSTDHQRIRA